MKNSINIRYFNGRSIHKNRITNIFKRISCIPCLFIFRMVIFILQLCQFIIFTIIDILRICR